jgi:hypothetical protein
VNNRIPDDSCDECCMWWVEGKKVGDGASQTLLGRGDKGRSETFTYKMPKEEGMQIAIGRRGDV